MEYKKEDLIKSPLNYVGGKFKLLPQILPLFPDSINTFYKNAKNTCDFSREMNWHDYFTKMIAF